MHEPEGRPCYQPVISFPPPVTFGLIAFAAVLNVEGQGQRCYGHRRMVPIMEHEFKNSTLRTRQVPSDPMGTSVETKYAGIMHLSIQPFLGVSARGSRDNVHPNSSNICIG